MDCVELGLKEIHCEFSLSLAKQPRDKLVVKPQSDLQALQSLDSSRMESVGNCVLDLVQRDFKSSEIPSLLFLQCLHCLSSQLCQSSGYTRPPLSLPTSTQPSLSPTANSQGAKSESSQSTQSSTLLLACEEPGHGLSHSQSYQNALVLYVTAALCEHMSNDILKGISELCLLLEAISAIVGCHAHFVSEASAGRSSGGHLLLVPAACPDLDKLPGGSISLSIVCGLLSALLGGEREVSP